MHDTGLIEIWAEPEKDTQYVIGADIGQGVGATFTVAHVLSVPDFGQPAEQVAKLRGNRFNSGTAGLLIYKLGMYYNRALIGVERNDQGIVTLDVLQGGKKGDWPQTASGYPNIYYQEVIDQHTKKTTKRIGWYTGPGLTKHFMLGQLQTAVAQDRIIIHSAATLVELKGFAWDPDKNDWVQTHRNPETHIAHTDETMALAIAWQMFSVAKYGAPKPKEEE